MESVAGLTRCYVCGEIATDCCRVMAKHSPQRIDGELWAVYRPASQWFYYCRKHPRRCESIHAGYAHRYYRAWWEGCNT